MKRFRLFVASLVACPILFIVSAQAQSNPVLSDPEVASVAVAANH